MHQLLIGVYLVLVGKTVVFTWILFCLILSAVFEASGALVNALKVLPLALPVLLFCQGVRLILRLNGVFDMRMGRSLLRYYAAAAVVCVLGFFKEPAGLAAVLFLTIAGVLMVLCTSPDEPEQEAT